MVDVSIIIVNYNTHKITEECISSIYKFTRDVSFEIILVDNNSTDESFNVFSNDKRILYLYQTENLGYGKANNIGFKYSSGKYIFLLNSDTLLKSNAIKEFYDFLSKASNRIACVGTMLRDENDNFIHSYGVFPTVLTGLKWYSILGIILYKLGFKEKNNNIANNKYVDYIVGADLFLRREVIEKLGLFDPDFFMYFEDTEMQFRYNTFGYKSFLFNNPQIIHLENYSTNKTYSDNIDKMKLLLNSYLIFLKKSRGLLWYLVFRLIYIIISPLWIIHPHYTICNKIKLIKLAFIKINK